MIATPITPETAFLHTCLEFEEGRMRTRLAQKAVIAEALADHYSPKAFLEAALVSLLLWWGLLEFCMWLWRMA